MSVCVEIPSGDGEEYIVGRFAKPGHSMLKRRNETLVVMTHGFPDSSMFGHGDFYGDLEYLFTDKGFATLRFDFRGCGESEGLKQDFSLQKADEDMHIIRGWIEREGFQNLIYVGEGLGAATCLRNMTDNVRLLFLFWPVCDLRAYAVEQFEGDQYDLDMDVAGYVTIDGHMIGRTLIRDLLMNDLKPFLKDMKVPVLVQHGALDHKISTRQIDFLKKHTVARRADITSYQDGVHGLPDARHRKMILYHIGEFIERYI